MFQSKRKESVTTQKNNENKKINLTKTQKMQTKFQKDNIFFKKEKQMA